MASDFTRILLLTAMAFAAPVLLVEKRNKEKQHAVNQDRQNTVDDNSAAEIPVHFRRFLFSVTMSP